MAYEKTNWVDNETPINAANLNKMEDGIVEASKTGGVLDGTIVEWEEDEIPEGYEEVEKDIINSKSITDKENKTYSANIIDGLVSDSVKIEDISDTVINFNEGYSKATGFRIYKQGKRIFGCLNFQKSSNWTTANGDIEIGIINYKPPYGFYANMTTADYFWAIGVNGYLAIESTGKILVKVSDVSKKVIKSYIEFVTN